MDFKHSLRANRVSLGLVFLLLPAFISAQRIEVVDLGAPIDLIGSGFSAAGLNGLPSSQLNLGSVFGRSLSSSPSRILRTDTLGLSASLRGSPAIVAHENRTPGDRAAFAASSALTAGQSEKSETGGQTVTSSLRASANALGGDARAGRERPFLLRLGTEPNGLRAATDDAGVHRNAGAIFTHKANLTPDDVAPDLNAVPAAQPRASRNLKISGDLKRGITLVDIGAKIIGSANKSIELAVGDIIAKPEIIGALQHARLRGVEIRILLFPPEHALFPKLIASLSNETEAARAIPSRR